MRVGDLACFEAGFANRFCPADGAKTQGDPPSADPDRHPSPTLRLSTRNLPRDPVPARGPSRQFRAGDSMEEARSINCIVQMQLAVERPVLQKDWHKGLGFCRATS